MSKKSSDGLVTLYRIPDTYATWMDAPEGDEIEVTREEADRLLAFVPPAFSETRPKVTYLVGEKGPELIVPPAGSVVIPPTP